MVHESISAIRIGLHSKTLFYEFCWLWSQQHAKCWVKAVLVRGAAGMQRCMATGMAIRINKWYRLLGHRRIIRTATHPPQITWEASQGIAHCGAHIQIRRYSRSAKYERNTDMHSPCTAPQSDKKAHVNMHKTRATCLCSDVVALLQHITKFSS